MPVIAWVSTTSLENFDAGTSPSKTAFAKTNGQRFYALEDSMGFMIGSAISLDKKFHQYRESMEKIRDCEDLDPKIKKLLDGFLNIWNLLDVPAQ